MKKQILVPLDGSALLEAVLRHAVSLARGMSGSLTLVRVVPDMLLPGPLEGGFPAAPGVWETHGRRRLVAEEYLAGIADRLLAEELVVERVVLEGDPARSIVHYAEGHPYVKLIAMSTHARSGLSRWVLGSVAEQVLHDTPVPLLLVHPERGEAALQNLAAGPVRKILVPLDGSAFAEHALEQASDLAADLGAGIVLLTVLTTEYDVLLVEGSLEQDRLPASWEGEGQWAVAYLGELARRLRLERITVEVRTASGDPAAEILKTTAKMGADMIVMSTHGRSGLPRLWLGSVALNVVRHTSHPVLLVRAKERVKEVESVGARGPVLAVGAI